jgi:signal transduction histidine kinase
MHWALLVGAVLVEAVSIGLSWGREPAWDTLIYAANALANVVAGMLIVARHSGHAVGRLLIAIGLAQAIVNDLAQAWALAGTSRGWAGAAPADLVANSNWPIGGALLAATFVIFPSGTLPRSGKVWPWVLPLGCIGSVVLMAGWATGDQMSELLVSRQNPLHSESVPSPLLFWTGLSALAASMLLGALAMVLRMRAATGVERQQLKWMVFAVGLTLAVLLPSAPFFTDLVAVPIADALVTLVIPLAALAAIWRYRLYDIELIISRTVLYAGVTAALTVVFIGLIVGLGVVFGRGSATATAGATLAVALVFRPLRAWLQKYVDRWFARGRYDALADVSHFMADLKAGQREPEDVEQVLVDATARLDSDEARSALLPALRQEASLAMEMVRLRAELRTQLAEVEDSRRRIVEATEAERHRIERDLHDGAQQRLVSIGLTVRHIQHALGDAAPEVTRSIEAAVLEVSETIEELREIARGIRPGVLDDGLGSALRDLAQRTALPLIVAVPERRFPKELETAAYFIACEGVTNAVKHADATRVGLEVCQVPGGLVVRVSDDGAGGATLRGGGGLVGVSDRIATLGGRLTITSNPGQGTTLVAELACAS